MIVFVSDFTPIPYSSKKLNIDGRLALSLLKSENKILWLRSSFNHYQKKHEYFNFSARNFEVKTLASFGYTTNKSLKRIFHNIFFGLMLFWKLLWTPNLTCIFSPIPSVEVSFLVSLLCRIKRVNHIVIVYDMWPDILIEYKDKSTIKNLFFSILAYIYRPLVIHTLRNAHEVLAVSKTYLKWAKDLGAINLELVYIGCDTPKPRKHKNSLPIVVSFIGSWGNSSDISLIIRAAKILENDSRYFFYIAGKTEVDECDIVEKVGNNVKIMGWLNDDQKEGLLNKTDVAVMAYKSYALQSLPNKIFEYLSHGCYLISTLDGECKNFINQNNLGISISSGFAEELVYELYRYLIVKDKYTPEKLSKFALKQFGSDYFDNITRKLAVNFSSL